MLTDSIENSAQECYFEKVCNNNRKIKRYFFSEITFKSDRSDSLSFTPKSLSYGHNFVSLTSDIIYIIPASNQEHGGQVRIFQDIARI